MTPEQEIFTWRTERWPKPDDRSEISMALTRLPSIHDAAKLAEETGEVIGAVIKVGEGRATYNEFKAELGDALIALSVIAGRHGWTLDELRANRWEEVKER